jgi:hypothetical protein
MISANRSGNTRLTSEDLAVDLVPAGQDRTTRTSADPGRRRLGDVVAGWP